MQEAYDADSRRFLQSSDHHARLTIRLSIGTAQVQEAIESAGL